VPVPFFFRFFATGLGALGVLGWRRKPEGAGGNKLSATCSITENVLRNASRKRLGAARGLGAFFGDGPDLGKAR
jgi:hypothetical protein